MVSEGKISKVVADELGVSKRTVEFHLRNVYDKLGVSNRFQAFRVATRLELIAFNEQSLAPANHRSFFYKRRASRIIGTLIEIISVFGG